MDCLSAWEPDRWRLALCPGALSHRRARDTVGYLLAGISGIELLGHAGDSGIGADICFDGCVVNLPKITNHQSQITNYRRRRRVLFAVGLQLKLIGIVYLPIVALVLWIRSFVRWSASGRTTAHEAPALAGKDFGSGVERRCGDTAPYLGLGISCAVFGVSVVVGFVALNYMTGSTLGIQLKQAWAAHFAAAKSSEYGSAAEHRFEWSVLLKNWDTVVPAIVGLLFLVTHLKKSFSSSSSGLVSHSFLPVLWFLLTLAVFSIHKPWWAYYYVHNAIPLCWCAGIGICWGIGLVWDRLRGPSFVKSTSEGRRGGFLMGQRALSAIVGLFVLASLAWMGGRIYLETVGIRALPKIHSSYVLKKIEQYKPFTRFMFTDRPIYSFHADIPLPPHVAMLPIKRFWTGEMNNERLVAELESAKPGIILWANDSREVPFQELLRREYQVVYFDDANRLFVHKSIVKKVRRF